MASRRLFETIAALQPLRPGVRFYHLRSRRFDARAHRRRSPSKYNRKTGIDGRRARHVRRIYQSRTARRSSTISHAPASSTSSRCAATRRRRRPAFEPPPGGFAHAARTRRDAASATTTSASARRAIPRNIRKPSARRTISHALREKVDAGADFLVSQLFFDNATYFDFDRRVRAAGIAVPMLPGLMPITNFDQIRRFVALCGATIPPKLHVEMTLRRGDREAVEALGVAYASMQAVELLQSGVPGVHFYTLNRSPATRAIVSALLAASAWRRPGYSSATHR